MMTNATATQSSASIALSFQRRIDGAIDRVRVRRRSGQPLDDGAGGIGRDCADIAHGGGASFRDRLFGGGKLCCEPPFERFAIGFGLRIQLVTNIRTDALRLGTGIRKLRLVSLQRRVGLISQLLRFRKIGVDCALPRHQHSLHPRQRHARDDDVKQPESNGERYQLRGAGIAFERREAALVSAAFGAGMCAGRSAAMGVVASGHLVVSHGALRSRRRNAGAFSDACQNTNSNSSATSSEKMPSASVTAKPKIRLPNWPWAADGLRMAAAR